MVNEITYKYVRGKGWLAGYWPDEEPRMREEVFQTYIQPLEFQSLPPQPDGWRYLTMPVQIQRANDYYMVDDLSPMTTQRWYGENDAADALEYAITSHTRATPRR